MNKISRTLLVVLIIFSTVSIANTNLDGGLTRETLPQNIEDGDWLANGSKIIFSHRVRFDKYYWSSNRTFYRFRLFIRNTTEMGEEIMLNISLGDEDYVAPLVSPDGERIMFVVTRNDHPCSLHIMNSSGDGIYSISYITGRYPSTVVAAWLSNEKIVFWDSHFLYFDFNDEISSEGQIYTFDIESGVFQETTDPPNQLFKGKLVTSHNTNAEGDTIFVKDLLREGSDEQDGKKREKMSPMDIFVVVLSTPLAILLLCLIFKATKKKK